jgi:hypothetical protein
MEDAGTPLRCGRCHVWKGEDEYRRHALKFGRKRFCIGCAGAEVRACQKCIRILIQSSFGTTWDEEDATRTCLECLLGRRQRECGECGTRRPVHAFSQWQWEKKGGSRICESCMVRKHQCAICERVRSDMSLTERETSQGKMRACVACEKCVCAGVGCGRVVTASEREGIAQRHASCDNTKVWCSKCRGKCDMCGQRLAAPMSPRQCARLQGKYRRWAPIAATSTPAMVVASSARRQSIVTSRGTEEKARECVRCVQKKRSGHSSAKI